MQMLPGQEPVRKPHPARHAFSAAGIAVFIALILGGFFAAAYYVSFILTGGNMAAVISSALVELANEDRAAEDLGALSVNPLLTLAAQAKADDMAARGYFSHVTPDGREPWDFIREQGYEYGAAGENLAVNFSDSENVEEAWMNSPTHRANILSTKFTEIGIATARGEYKGKMTTFVVQMFGTPRISAETPPPRQAPVPEDPNEVAVTDVSADILGTDAPEASPPAVARGESSGGNSANRLAASPENILRVVYLLCGLIILAALALTTRLEFRRHHVRHVATAAFLLMLMGGTLMLADRVIFAEPQLNATAAVHEALP